MKRFIVGVPASGCTEKSEVPCTCEEEAIAMAAGAKLMGRDVLVFMQNSGLGRCVDVITSLLRAYDIEVPLHIYHRNTPEHHRHMGEITEPLMNLLGYNEQETGDYRPNGNGK